MNNANAAQPPGSGNTAKGRGKTGGVRQRHLVIRQARLSDIPAIAALGRKIYAPKPWQTQRNVRAQINNFPDGQFVAECDGEVVGHAATFIISGDVALKPHTYDEITGDSMASRHDPKGDYLYGMEVCVDPDYRRLRIGQRIYDTRRRLCEEYGLRGITFGGRMPGYARRRRQYPDPWTYIQAVQDNKIRDSAIGFHLANEFTPIGVLERYEMNDDESAGYASHMVWENPLYSAEVVGDDEPAMGVPDRIRLATVQLQMRALKSISEFEHQIEYFVDVAADYRTDFVVFPELFTLELLSLEPKPLPPIEGIARIAEYTEWFLQFMQPLAMRYNVNIIAGTHPTRDEDGLIRNAAYAFLRDGAVHRRDKIHPTPDERYWWNIHGGDSAEVINTDCGPIGLLVCYDVEFPELARHLVDQGAMILFVPFCTDERRGYMRVRYCAHARAIENQCYVVMSGVVGNLPNVDNMDVHYAESCIITPCDFAFARDGIAADTAPNTETIAFADVRLSDLKLSRSSGTVNNLRDRRFDLYRVTWKNGERP